MKCTLAEAILAVGGDSLRYRGDTRSFTISSFNNLTWEGVPPSWEDIISYENSIIIPKTVPSSVTAFQAKASLHLSGLLENVIAAIETADVLTQLAWENASFHRHSDMIKNLSLSLGLTEEQIDDLFIAAEKIK